MGRRGDEQVRPDAVLLHVRDRPQADLALQAAEGRFERVQPPVGFREALGVGCDMRFQRTGCARSLALAFALSIFRLIVNTVQVRRNTRPDRMLESRPLGVQLPICRKLSTLDRGPMADGTRACDRSDECPTGPVRIGGRAIALPRLTRAHRKICSLERIPLCMRWGRTSTLGSPRHVRSRRGHPAPSTSLAAHRVPRTSSPHLSVTHFSRL